MSLQFGGALLWLIPTGLALLVLYLLKMRRKPLVVPALFLWPKQTEEIRANALIQRPRLNILFWLQLAALILIALALAGPQLLTRSLTGQVTMIVIDGSASMRATDVGESRFEEAKKLARQAIGEVDAGDRVGVVLAGAQPRIVFPLTDQPGIHAGKLNDLQAEDTPCDMGEALRLAAASLAAYEGARLVVLSDGAFKPVEDFKLSNGEVLFRPIGSSSKNMGISALGAATTARGKELYCAVRNYGIDANSATVTIEADGKVLESKTIQVKAGGTWGATLRIPSDTKLCRAVLEVEDALSADNVRVTSVTDDSTLRVLLVGPGDYFLERALALDRRVALERSAKLPEGEAAGTPGAGDYDLVVFSGAPESAVKARGVLAFGSPSAASPVSGQGSASRPEFLSSQDHPVVRNIEFGNVYLDRIEKVSLRPGARAVAETREGPLVAVRESAGKRQVYVAFDLIKSDWPLHPGFPMFIGQAITYLAGEGRKDVAAMAAGKPFTIPLAPGERFSAPESVRVSMQDGYAIVRGLPRVGEYEFEVGPAKQRFFANLEDPDEPKIEPAAFVQLGSKRVTQTAVPQRPTDLWRWAVLFGLLILAAEWWVFIRKS